MNAKACIECGIDITHRGHNAKRCESCGDASRKTKANESRKKWYRDNHDAVLAYERDYYAADPQKYRTTRTGYMRTYRQANPVRMMLIAAAARARRKGIDFALTEADVLIPDRCPIYGMQLQRGAGVFTASSPTIDRIDNTRGYVPGNVHVISQKANRLKRDYPLEKLAQRQDELGRWARSRLTYGAAPAPLHRRAKL